MSHTPLWLKKMQLLKLLQDFKRSIRLVKESFRKLLFEYVIAGSWSDDEPFGLSKEQIQEEISQVLAADGTEEIARFIGPVTGEQKLDLLRSGDVFILPSYSEGQSVAVLEALAAGLPVVATSVGAIPDVVENGEDGYLCRVGDPADLAEKICRIAADVELRSGMSRNARERYLRFHTKARFEERMIEVFRRSVE